MAIDRQHLRELSRNAVESVPFGSLPIALGDAVATRRIRTIYFMKLMTDQAAQLQVTLWRDGITATVPLDVVQIPGKGSFEVGKPYLLMGTDLEEPVYTLLEGQQVGINGSGTAEILFAFMSFFDEEG